ncbi:MAG TPA: hypothetical protein VMV91_14300 [Rhodocyclaceae bacterium]|nr:hypothetical protein [Rhodocyclaceae bacterium]
MDSSKLDSLINDLEYMVRDATSQYRVRDGHYLLSVMHRDWGPFFTKAKEIQEGFNSRVLYPSKRDRDAAWVRFNDLRTEVYEHANKQRSDIRADSEALRDKILQLAEKARYDWLADKVMFFLPATTGETMKLYGQVLKDSGKMLSENKHRMLKEHKDECFDRILNVRQTHDLFWGEYKEQRTRQRAEAESRRSEVANRVQNNIHANRDKLEKAAEAYTRIRANLESNFEKLESARSSEFAERVAWWIEEDKEKLRSISDSIDRLKEWIEEDETRLSDIHNRH